MPMKNSNYTKITTGAVEEHFDVISADYDKFKLMHWYYYDSLKRALHDELGDLGKKTVLEVGCGTGDLLASLAPGRGVGIDVSSGMIGIASRKHRVVGGKTLSFLHVSAPDLVRRSKDRYDAIVCVDVIEHMADVSVDITALSSLVKHDGEIVILMANPLWEPLLLLFEKLKMKMPEGPHYRMPYRDVKRVLVEVGFGVVRHDWYLAFPKYVPFFSDFFNAIVHAIPVVRRLGLIEMIVARPTHSGSRFSDFYGRLQS
jgi:ubiquinone/menaquinone biosynthesis C-methylase UbiE